MAKNRTFWKGALCGAAVAYAADRLLQLRRGKKSRLGVIRGKASVLPMSLRRDDGAGDPALLTSDRSRSRPVFERRGGAPGGAAAAEVHEVPGHPGQQIDHNNAAQPVHSASRTQFHPPARDSQI